MQRKQHEIDSLSLQENDIGHLLALPDIHKEGSMTLLTPDPLIQEYPVKTIW
jgi:PIN domain nuclease of toxin-antitoxin system